MERTRKILISIETSFEYGRGIVRGVACYSRLHGPWILCLDTPKYRKADLTKSWLVEEGINGVLWHKADREIGRMFSALKLPMIVAAGLNKRLPGQYHIMPDDEAIGRMGANHFLARGFHHFAYCGFRSLFWSVDRKHGFEKQVADSGFEAILYQPPTTRSNISVNKERAHLVEWLGKLPKPVGLMACNDDRAQQVYEACRLAEIHIPEEIAVLGVDNDEFLCEVLTPPLSSITLNTEAAGYQAAAVLDKLMAGESIGPQHIPVCPIDVETRQSTDLLAIEDQQLAVAVRFIREHATEAIRVDDVARAAVLSRRVLEKRFRAVFDRTVHEEIRHARLSRAVRMLVETNMSVTQIATALGFSEVRDLTRSFTRYKGLTPLAFRKAHGAK